MDGLQILAGLLLVGRLIAIVILWRVFRVQMNLLRLSIDPEVLDFRRKLHYMTIALLIGNFPSVILDAVVMAGVKRTLPYLIVYAVFNVITMIIAASMIDRMYRLAGNTKEVNDLEREYNRVKNRGK